MLKQLMRLLISCIIFSCYANNNFDKWIVVTTIHYPSIALKKFASLKDWHLVVVGDKKTPKDWHLDNCVYLDIETQSKLHFMSAKLLPLNHYSRKNIGYLYAIAHGAKIIYDTDDDNILLQDNIPYLAPNTTISMYNTKDPVVNPYAYFGQSTIWPRGYPLEHIKDLQPDQYIEKKGHILIQQGLVNGDPDVDAIFRLTRDIDILFVTDRQPIALPTGTFCPFNSQNTIFHYQAFWALLIPITTSFRVCDIWRGYYAQRLLWDIQGSLCFTAPSVMQDRNIHNLLADFTDEIDMYTKTKKLISFLKTWQSSKTTIFERAISLTDAMIEQNFYYAKDGQLIRAWLQDLKDIGYQEPELAL